MPERHTLHWKRPHHRKHIEPHGRIVRARGPIIYTLMGLNIFALAATIISLLISVNTANSKASLAVSKAEANGAKIAAIQQSRIDSSYDTCRIIAHILVVSARVSHRPHAQQKTQAFIKQLKLNNCSTFAQRVTKPRVPIDGTVKRQLQQLTQHHQ